MGYGVLNMYTKHVRVVGSKRATKQSSYAEIVIVIKKF